MRSLSRLSVAWFAGLLLVSACGKKHPEQGHAKFLAPPGEMAPTAAEPMRMQGAPAPVNTPENPGQYVIRTAYLRVRVADLAAYESAVTVFTRQAGGYVASQSASNTGTQLDASFTLRVPSAKLDAFLASLAGSAALVVERNVSSEDVTAQYVDVEARIKARQAVEQQYLALLKQARSVQDMVAIQQKLGEIREQIESSEAVRKSLAGQIEYATVNLNAFQEIDEAFFRAGGWWKAVEGAFAEGITMLFGAVLFVVRLWPFILVFLVVALVVRLRRRRA